MGHEYVTFGYQLMYWCVRSASEKYSVCAKAPCGLRNVQLLWPRLLSSAQLSAQPPLSQYPVRTASITSGSTLIGHCKSAPVEARVTVKRSPAAVIFSGTAAPDASSALGAGTRATTAP